MPDPLPDHYAALKLRSSATQQEIKAAYKKLALLYHPDRNRDDGEATKKFQIIQAAYEVLNDIQKKTAYDRVRLREVPGVRVRMSTAQPKPAPTAQTRQYESARQKMHNNEGGRPPSGYGYREGGFSRSYADPYGSSREYRRTPQESESSTRAHTGHSTTASGWSQKKASDGFAYARERKYSTSNPKMGTHKGNTMWDETPDERRRAATPPPRNQGASSTGPPMGSAGHYAYMQDRAKSRGASPTMWQERASAPYSYTPKEKYHAQYRAASPPPVRTRESSSRKKSSRDTPSSGRHTGTDSGDDYETPPAFQKHTPRSTKPKSTKPQSVPIPISSDSEDDLAKTFAEREAKRAQAEAKATKTRPKRSSTNPNPDYLSSNYKPSNGSIPRPHRVPSPAQPQRPQTYSQSHAYQQAHYPPAQSGYPAPGPPPPQPHARSEARPGLQQTFSYDPYNRPDFFDYRMDSHDDSFDFNNYSKAPNAGQQPSFSQTPSFNFASTGTHPHPRPSDTPPSHATPSPAQQPPGPGGLYGFPLNNYPDYSGTMPTFGAETPKQQVPPAQSSSRATPQESSANKNDYTSYFKFPSDWVPQAAPNGNMFKRSEPDLRDKKRNPTRTSSAPRFEDLNRAHLHPESAARPQTNGAPPKASAEEEKEENKDEQGSTSRRRSGSGRESLQPMDIDPPLSSSSERPNITTIDVEPPMSPDQSSSAPPPQTHPTINIQPINPPPPPGTAHQSQSPLQSPNSEFTFAFATPKGIRENFNLFSLPLKTKTSAGPQAPRTEPIPQATFHPHPAPPSSAHPTRSVFDTSGLTSSLNPPGIGLGLNNLSDLKEAIPFTSKAAPEVSLADDSDPKPMVKPLEIPKFTGKFPPLMNTYKTLPVEQVVREYNKAATAEIEIYVRVYQIWEGLMLSLLNSVSNSTAKAVITGEFEDESDDEQAKGKTDKEKTTEPLFVEFNKHLQNNNERMERYFQKLEQKRRIREVWEKQQAMYEANLRKISELRTWIQMQKKNLERM